MPLANSFMKGVKLFVYLCVLLPVSASEAQSRRPKMPFFTHTEVGGLFGRVVSGPSTAEVVDNKLSLTAQTLNGVRLTKRLAVGALVGIDWYKAALLLPVGAGVRYQLTLPSTHNVSLFASADAGYGMTWLHKNSTGYHVRGGLMLNPGVGLRLGKPEGGGMTLTLSYKRQEAQVEKPLRWGEIQRDERRMYNRLCIRLGISL